MSDSDSSSSGGEEQFLDISSPYPLFSLITTEKKPSSFEIPLGWTLHVTGATLGSDAKKGKRTLLACATPDGVNGVICSLREGAQEHVSLNLVLLPSPDQMVVQFQADTEATVHISGYLEPVDVGLDEEDSEDDFEDEEIDSDEAGSDSEELSPEMLVAGSDDEDEEVAARLASDKTLRSLVDAVKSNGGADFSSDEGDSFSNDSEEEEDEAPQAVPIKQAKKGKRAAEAAEERPAKKSKKSEKAAAAKAKAEAAAKAMAEEEERLARAAEEAAAAKKQAKKERKEKLKKEKEAKAKAPKIVKAGNGLEYQDVRVGDGPVVKPGRRLAMRYHGTLTNGKKFDGNMPRGKPFEFRFGAGEVIKGWDLGLKGMRVGGLRKLRIPPHLGYGRQRSGPIPANSTLLFDVEVVGQK